MDESIVGLYRAEIDILKQQVEDLKEANDKSNSKNATLVNKIRSLESVIEQAAIANQDLNDAFGFVNRQLRETGNNQVSEIPTYREPDQAIEHQYYDLARQSISWVSERDKMDQRIKFLERECERYNRDNNTLGKQVRHLLKSLEEERGMIVRRQKDVQQQLSCAADVIDQHLVTFESIEELQKQNQKLLSLVKEMTAREEERETVVENDEIRRLNQELDELRAKLEKTESDRENILQSLNTIYKERDLFKILLSKSRDVEHMTPEIFQRMVSVAVSSGPIAIAGAPESSIEKGVLIDHLKDSMSKLEQEVADLKKELAENRTKHDEEVKLKCDLLEKAHLKIQKESMRVDTIKERNDVLEQNLKTLTVEYDEIRAKCQKMTFEFDIVKKQCETFESDLKSVTAQYEDARTKCQRMTFELEQMKKQHDEQYVKITNLTKNHDEVCRKYNRTADEYDRVKKRHDELEMQTQDARRTIAVLQSLRNYERDGRLKSIRKIQRLRRRMDRLKSSISRSVKTKNQITTIKTSSPKAIATKISSPRAITTKTSSPITIATNISSPKVTANKTGGIQTLSQQAVTSQTNSPRAIANKISSPMVNAIQTHSPQTPPIQTYSPKAIATKPIHVDSQPELPMLVLDSQPELLPMVLDHQSEQSVVGDAEASVEVHPEPSVQLHTDPAVEVHPEPIMEVHSEPPMEADPTPSLEGGPEPSVEVEDPQPAQKLFTLKRRNF